MTKAEATSRFVALCGAKQGPQGFVAEPQKPVTFRARIDMSTSTTKTSFLLGNWAALLGVVDGDFGPRKWPSIGGIAKFDEMNKIF